MQSPDIFHYTTLESYLGRYFQYRKALNPSFSYALWARKLGVKSPATLHMITKGQRTPGKNLILKLKKDLALNSDEGRFFEILVDLKKHKSHLTASLELMKELESRHPDKGFKLIDHDEFKMISNWYCWALLEMMNLKGFQENPQWIVEKMEYAVSESEIREALATMERMQLLGRDRNGKLIRTSKPLKTRSDRAFEGIRNFHAQVLKNATESLHKHSVEERNFECLTLSMSSSKISDAKKMIRDFVDEFCRKFDDPNANRVHQMQVSLIPATLNLRESKKMKSLIFNFVWSSLVFARSGGVVSNGADDVVKSYAWFLGTKPIQACMEIAPDYLVSKNQIEDILQRGIMTWKIYVTLKELESDWPEDRPFLNFNYNVKSSCTGHEDITFYFGVTNDRVEKIRALYRNPRAFSHIEKYDFKTGQGSGFVWFDKLSPSSPWSPYQQLLGLLMHEMGHVYGSEHVAETIMREDLVPLIHKTIQQPGVSRIIDLLASRIDHTRELYFSENRGFSAYSPALVEPNTAQKEIFKRIFKRDFQRAIWMRFKQGHDENSDNAELTVADESGPLLPQSQWVGGTDPQSPNGYRQERELRGHTLPIVFDPGSKLDFSTSDSQVFRTSYNQREKSFSIPSFVIQGKLILNSDTGESVPVTYSLNKGNYEYIRMLIQLDPQAGMQEFFIAPLVHLPLTVP